MTLHLYSLKNRLSGLFERPVAEIYDEKEYPEYLAQSLALAEIPVLTRYKEYDVIKIGELDNRTGVITPKTDWIMSLESMCATYIANKEVKNEQDRSQESTGA